MTAADLLARLDGVRPRGDGRWTARCPAHDDRTPSLSVAAGERAVLIRCWAGCEVAAICDAVGLRIRDLYYDAGTADPQARARARRERAVRDAARRDAWRREMVRLDAARQADAVIARYAGVNIDSWTPAQLDAAWARLGAAYDILLTIRDNGGQDDDGR